MLLTYLLLQKLNLFNECYVVILKNKTKKIKEVTSVTSLELIVPEQSLSKNLQQVECKALHISVKIT